MKKFNIYNSFIFKIIDNDIKNKNIKINTRFAPEPNGYLHIGHVKSIFINFIIAKKYNGLFNLRFDDTNPIKSKYKYVKSIKNDIRWLGFNWDNENYTSNYFDNIYEFAIKLIKKKLAYVDELSKEEFKKYKGNFLIKGIDSPYRNRTIKENILFFEKMKYGEFEENKACLRAKINMKSKNFIIRDPVLYRIKFLNHFRTKDKWCIYPTYDFSHCICDFLENIKYSLCTLEFIENNIIYNWILDSLNIKNKPVQYEYSKLNIEYFLLSKRKLNNLVKNKIVYWNDPRMPTISGLKNKGYTKKSIIDFCKNIGLTKKNSTLSIKYLENFLRKDLNKKSIRIMSVLNPIILFIYNISKNYIEFINIPIDIKNSNLGYKKVKFCNKLYVDKYDFLNENLNYNSFIGKLIKLRHSYIIKIKNIKIINNNTIIFSKCYFKTINSIYFKKNKVYKIIHWVSCIENYKSFFKIYYNLFNINKIEKLDNFLDYLNINSFIIKKGYTERSTLVLKKNKSYQCERVGYFKIDNIDYNNFKIIFTQILKINK